MAVVIVILSMTLNEKRSELKSLEARYQKNIDDLRIRLMAVYLDDGKEGEFDDKYSRLEAHLESHQRSRVTGERVKSSLTKKEEKVWFAYCADLWYWRIEDLRYRQPEESLEPILEIALNIKQKQKGIAGKELGMVGFASWIDRVLGDERYSDVQKIKKVQAEALYVKKKKRWS